MERAKTTKSGMLCPSHCLSLILVPMHSIEFIILQTFSINYFMSHYVPPAPTVFYKIWFIIRFVSEKVVFNLFYLVGPVII
jgi:hypothetical protein